MDSISPITENIADTLQQDTDHVLCTLPTGYKNPIHDLLAVGPLTRTEIPLDVVNMLITAGFDVDCTDPNYGHPCLKIAIEMHHYNAIRLLMPCIHWGQLRRCDFATCGLGASQNSAAPQT